MYKLRSLPKYKGVTPFAVGTKDELIKHAKGLPFPTYLEDGEGNEVEVIPNN